MGGLAREGRLEAPGERGDRKIQPNLLNIPSVAKKYT